MVPWVGLQGVTVAFPSLFTCMYFIRLGNKDESNQAPQLRATNMKTVDPPTTVFSDDILPLQEALI